ncbi:Putative transposase, YhgA-like protein [Rickettsia tamurae subsp. buchneri]|uniref:Transposase, YhgA-like protein n=1 Tax=Rickettsia tamurae subsp. buchneri TaxID=1462938 RepID=A0A8E0WM56_9RICK|nr:Putative transposase, YhgA-like protein [Rickettsia tamurae subsp. buchneri]
MSFKNKININSVKIEKESFITEDLRKRLSDVIYSVSLKKNNIKDSTTESVNDDKAYVYVLIEHKDIRTQIKRINKKEVNSL